MMARGWTFKRLTITLLAVGAVVMTGCSTDSIVAEIDGDKITKAEFDASFSAYKSQYEAQYGSESWKETVDGKTKEEKAKEQVLDRIIEGRLLVKKAKELSVSVIEADVDKEINEYKGYFKTEEAFSEFLKTQNMTSESFTQLIRNDLLSARVYEKVNADTKITEMEVKAYYDANTEKFSEAKLSQIKVDTLDVAEDIKGRLDKGEDFTALAKEFTKDPEGKANGGSLGTLSYGALTDPANQVAFELKAGEISDPIKTDSGYLILRCEAVSQRSLAEATNSIQNQLILTKKDAVFEELIAQLKEKTKIEKYLEKL